MYVLGIIFLIVTVITSLILYLLSNDARILFKRVLILIMKKVKN
jgi:hypothetical protein